MKLKLVCWLKSGAKVVEVIEYDESDSIQVAIEDKFFVEEAIIDGMRGKTEVLEFNTLVINTHEVSAYRLTIEEDE